MKEISVLTSSILLLQKIFFLRGENFVLLDADF